MSIWETIKGMDFIDSVEAAMKKMVEQNEETNYQIREIESKLAEMNHTLDQVLAELEEARK